MQTQSQQPSSYCPDYRAIAALLIANPWEVPMNKHPVYCKIAEVAKILRISERQVRRLIVQGLLKPKN